MGRGRPAAKDGGGTKAKVAVEKAPRTTRGLRKSYVEDAGSEPEDFKEDMPSSPEVAKDDSESEYAGESSGSEYGKKKKKGKVSPKKTPAKRGRKPAGKAQLSPKKPGRPGRKPKAAASSNGKRKRPAESSEDEEEEKISSEEISEDEASGSGDTSGSEYGKKKSNKKLKKEKPPTRSQPKRQAATSPKKRGRKPKEATNGNKKPKLSEEVEKSEEEEMEIDEQEKKKSDDEGGATTEDEVKEPETVAEKKTAKVEDKLEAKEDEEKIEDPDSPKSEEDKQSESEEEETVEKPKTTKEKPSTAANDKGKQGALLNRTETDFPSLDVSCEKKTTNGEAWNFKILCWNVAGIRAWVKKSGLEYLGVEDPDIVCLQEVKCSDTTKPADMKSLSKYPHTYWSYPKEAKGINGVATLCKVKPESVTNGFPIGDNDSEEDKKFKRSFNEEGRLIVTEFEKFYLFNAYVPNGGRNGGGVKEDKKKPYPPRVSNGERQAWDRLFRDYIKALEEKKPVIVTGDFNVAHEPIDLANPSTNSNTAGFTKEEREGFTELLSSTKLVDTFRSLYPEEKGYTFWSYMNNARAKNIGWRLDYFLLSEKLRDSLCESIMRKDVYGSDHCPIVLFAHF